MGLSCEFECYCRTDSAEYKALAQNTFIELWNQGPVCLAKRPNNYGPNGGTTIADQEIIYEKFQLTLFT